MYGRTRNLELVKALQISGDPAGAKVIVLPQLQDFADNRRQRLARRMMWRAWTISKTGFA